MQDGQTGKGMTLQLLPLGYQYKHWLVYQTKSWGAFFCNNSGYAYSFFIPKKNIVLTEIEVT